MAGAGLATSSSRVAAGSKYKNKVGLEALLASRFDFQRPESSFEICIWVWLQKVEKKKKHLVTTMENFGMPVKEYGDYVKSWHENHQWTLWNWPAI